MTSSLLPFSPHQLRLLSRSCYGDPLLPQYLERTLSEGPGDYAWSPAPGTYLGEQVPLWERVFTQIWHQGTLYPATYVALPVWCEVVIKSPDRNHAPLLERIGLIEQSRGRQEKKLALVVGQDMILAYEAALQRLLPILPGQIKLQEDATPGGLSTIRNLLGLQAFALGKRWAGMLLSRQVEPWIDLESGEPSMALIDAAMMLERDDLPEAIRAGRRKQ